MCLQWVRFFYQHPLSLSFKAFSFPSLFKDKKIIYQGSREKGLVRDIKLPLGDSGIEEEEPEHRIIES